MSRSRFKSTPKDSSPSSSSLTHDNPPPAKRPRLTPSSASVTSKDSTPPTDIDSARKASALRVLNVWSQLAERYNKRMDEDDIIDLYSGAIVKDRGVLRSTNADYDIGRFAGDDEQEDSEDEPEDDEEADELDLLPRREAANDDFETLLRGVPPLSATADADDLSDFLEAERRRKELARDDDDDGDDAGREKVVSPRRKTRILERTPAGRGRSHKAQKVAGPSEKVPVKIQDSSGAEDEDEWASVGADNSDQEGLEKGESSEDELAVWSNTESSPVWPGSMPRSGVHDAAVEREVIEITDSDSDSDREFSLLLQGPSRKRRRSVSPSPAPYPSPRLPIPQNQFTPCPSTPHHEVQPPIPLDPVRAQEAHFLLAQAMHQLSYLMSTMLPAYTPSPPPPTPCHSFSPSLTFHLPFPSSHRKFPPPIISTVDVITTVFLTPSVLLIVVIDRRTARSSPSPKSDQPQKSVCQN
ncbi:hypothetical protein EDD16DRAFT_1724140 [Pisolithus croceorrhizus]|nr:hypothetical protein EDD16DRAFT_1724140 [Pisolithus croceorrhizus]KAI6150077.1 hypothetical protein EDD17DRAFT_1900648 [Pisolithus thermaeus]